jgi:hypothetical protein
MRLYIHAYRADRTIVLGNLDGQACIRDVKDYRRTSAYLYVKKHRRPHRHICFWQIEDEKGRVLETIENPHYIAPSLRNWKGSAVA